MVLSGPDSPGAASSRQARECAPWRTRRGRPVASSTCCACRSTVYYCGNGGTRDKWTRSEQTSNAPDAVARHCLGDHADVLDGLRPLERDADLHRRVVAPVPPGPLPALQVVPDQVRVDVIDSTPVLPTTQEIASVRLCQWDWTRTREDRRQRARRLPLRGPSCSPPRTWQGEAPCALSPNCGSALSASSRARPPSSGLCAPC